MEDEEWKRKFYDPLLGLDGIQKFYLKLKKENPAIKYKDVEAFVKKQEINQLVRGEQKSKFFRITAPPKSFQIDIMMLNRLPKEKGITALLIVIDITSRKAWAFPLKEQTNAEIVEALKQFIEKEKPIFLIEGDKQFDRAAILNLLKENDIRYAFEVAQEDHISSGNRLGIIDRFIRTLRAIIYKYMFALGDVNWMQRLPTLMENYNNSPHGAFRILGKEGKKLTPYEVYENEDIQKQIRDKKREENAEVREMNEGRVEIGTIVRYRLPKKDNFDKARPRFTIDLFKVIDQDFNKYVLQSEKTREVLKRKFKIQELLPVALVETAPQADMDRFREEYKAKRKEEKGEERVRREGIAPPPKKTQNRKEEEELGRGKRIKIIKKRTDF